MADSTVPDTKPGKGRGIGKIRRNKSSEKLGGASCLGPCRVCGTSATGFHYGVNTCEPCKGFFRRTMIRTQPYVCVNNRRCLIETGVRNPCPSCRYERCVAVGMSVEAIKIGRYTNEKRTLDLQNLLREPPNAEDTPVSTPGSSGLSETAGQYSHLIGLDIRDKLLDPGASPIPRLSEIYLTYQGSGSNDAFLEDLDFDSAEARDVNQLVKDSTDTEIDHNIPIREESEPDGTKQSLPHVIPAAPLHASPADPPQDPGGPNNLEAEMILQDHNVKLGVTGHESSDITHPGRDNPVESYSGDRLTPGFYLHALLTGNLVLPEITAAEKLELDEFAESMCANVYKSYHPIVQSQKSYPNLKHIPTPTKQDVFEPDDELIDIEQFWRIYSETGTQLDDRLTFMSRYYWFFDNGIRQCIKLSKNMPGFKDLHLDDQVYLLKEHLHDMWVLGMCESFDVKTRTIYGLQRGEIYQVDLRKFQRLESAISLMNAVQSVSDLKLSNKQRCLMLCCIRLLGDVGKLQNPQALLILQERYERSFLHYIRDTHLQDPLFPGKLKHTLHCLHMAQKLQFKEETDRLFVFRCKESTVPPLFEEFFASGLKL